MNKNQLTNILLTMSEILQPLNLDEYFYICFYSSAFKVAAETLNVVTVIVASGFPNNRSQSNTSCHKLLAKRQNQILELFLLV